MVQTVEKVVSRHVRVVLSYTPVETGPSLLYVQLFGIDLPGSPFELLVERTLPPPPPPRADDAEPESADGRTQALGARAAAQPVHHSSRQPDRRPPARAPSPQHSLRRHVTNGHLHAPDARAAAAPPASRPLDEFEVDEVRHLAALRALRERTRA